MLQNPPQLAPGVSQDISVYMVSVNDDAALTMCSSTSSVCLYSYNIQSSSSSFAVNLATGNVFGSGPERSCDLPSSGNFSKSNPWHKRYSSCSVCLSVCLSVTTLAVTCIYLVYILKIGCHWVLCDVSKIVPCVLELSINGQKEL